VNIANRIQKLEKRTGGERSSKIWCLVEGEPKPEEFKDGDIVFIVSSEVKELMTKGIERTKKSIPGAQTKIARTEAES
jgi:hypothetical protein